MEKLIILKIIMPASLLLGLIKYWSLSDSYKNEKWTLKFIEIWNDFVNFFIAGIIVYYFILVRWTPLFSDGLFRTSDLVLLFILILCLFGHLPVLSLNITKGIEAIIKRVLEK